MIGYHLTGTSFIQVTKFFGKLHESAEKNGKPVDCVQFFTRSPRAFVKSEEQIKPRKTLVASGSAFEDERVVPIIHSAYRATLRRINEPPIMRTFELEIRTMGAMKLKSPGYIVFHMGWNKTEGKGKAKKTLPADLDEYLARLKDLGALIKKLGEETLRTTMILFENMVGGLSVSEIIELHKRANASKNPLVRIALRRVGYCIDTAHLWGAGESIRTKKTAEKFCQEQLDKLPIYVAHINDSKVSFSSGIDRHERVGKGKINEEALKTLCRFFFRRKISMIVEVTENAEESMKWIWDAVKDGRKKKRFSP